MFTLFVTFQALVQWLIVLAIILPIGFFIAGRIDTQIKLFDPKSALFGLIALVVYINTIHIFLRLNSPYVLALLFLVSVTATTIVRKDIVRDVKSSILKHRSMQFQYRIYLLLALYLGNLTLAGIGNDDSRGYHLGLVRYFSESPIIPGLANIHSRFGFASTTYNLGAFFEGGLWSENGFRLANGFVLLFLIFECSSRLRRCLSTSTTPGSILLILATPVILSIAAKDPWTYISAPSPDLSAAVAVIIAFAYLLDSFFTWSTIDIAVAISVAALAATFRPLNLFALGIISIVSIFRYLRQPESRKIILIGAIPGISIISTFVLRNFIITGYPIYPGTITLTHPGWQLPYKVAKGDVEIISQWARGMRPLFSTSWFMPVLNQSKQDYYPMAVFLIVTGLLIRLNVLKLSRLGVELRRTAIWGSIVVCGSFLIWLIGAPTPRFGWGIIYSFSIFPLALLLVSQQDATKNYSKYVLVGLFVVLLAQASWIPLQHGTALIQPSTRGWPHGFVDIAKPATSPFKTRSGLILNVPNGGGDACYRLPLCTAQPNPNINEIRIWGRTGYSVK